MNDLTLVLICILFLVTIVLSGAFLLLYFIGNDIKFLFENDDDDPIDNLL